MIANAKEGNDRTGHAMLLTKAQVAEMLAVSETTVGNLHRYGDLTGKKVGRELRWHPDVVDSYVNKLREETS